MVFHGGPGLRTPRKRVVGSGAWLQQDAEGSRWHESNMCKAMEGKDYVTLAIARSRDGVMNSAVHTGIKPGWNPHEVTVTAIDSEASNKSDVAMEGISPRDEAESAPPLFQSRVPFHLPDPKCEQDMEYGEEEEADSKLQDAAGSPAVEDEEIDMGFDDFMEILGEKQPEDLSRSARLRLEVTSELINDFNPTPSHLFTQELLQSRAAVPPPRMDAKETVFLPSAEREELQSEAQQIDNRGFLFFPLSTRESSQPGTGTRAQFVGEHDPYPSTELQIGTLSDVQTNDPSSDFNPQEDSWHCSPTVLYEGSEIHDGAVRSSADVSMHGNDGEEQSSKTTVVGAQWNMGGPPTFQSLSNIDQDRPSLTYGSVLASDMDFAGTIPLLEGTGMDIPASTSTSVNKIVSTEPNVVDLTGDSDEDEDPIEFRAHLDHSGVLGKHRRLDHQESDYNKRLNLAGQNIESFRNDELDFMVHNIKSRTDLLCRESFLEPPHILGKDSRTKVWNYNQIRQPGNISGALHIPSREGSTIFLGHGMSSVAGTALPFAKGYAQNMADTRSSMQRSLVGTDTDEATPDDGLLSVPLLKHQRLALAWMEKRELGVNPRGGILADDQGLGKTISTISLILKARAPIQKALIIDLDSARLGALTVELEDDDEAESAGNSPAPKTLQNAPVSSLPPTVSTVGKDSGLLDTHEDVKLVSTKGRPAAGTLVVCPTSVLRQWAHELKEKVTEEAGLSVLIYHGSNRTRDPDELAKYDVVLSTYSIVSMEVPKQPLPEDKDNDQKMFGSTEYDLPPPFRGASKAKKPKKATENGKKGRGSGRGRLIEGENGSADSGPLARVNWFRVVLDEAQSIKNARTQVARAAWGLRAKRRWCLSGTPIQNAVDDLYSYFRFLRYAPFDAYKTFREKIKDPVTRTPLDGYRNLQRILKDVMLRRTKACQIDGKPIVNLPPRIVTLKQAEFSDEERTFYNNLENESRKQFQDYAAAGTLQSNYVNILWMLLRLRQACDHPLLVKGHQSKGAQKAVLETVKKLPDDQRMYLLSLLEANRSICAICNDLPDEAVVCLCAHVFCRQCISEQLATGDDTLCPIPKCKTYLNLSLVFTLSSLKNCESDEGWGTARSSSLEGLPHEEGSSAEDAGWKSSSKIDAVIDTLNALPQVFVVVENGKVVVQASKDLQDVRLLDTSGVKIVKQVPPNQTNQEPDSLVKHEENSENCDPGSAAKHEPVLPDVVKTTESTTSASAVAVEMLDSAQSIPRETVTPCPSTIVKSVKREAGSTDIVSIKEPLTRKIVESTEKAIVFSQWTSMLDLLEVKLKQAKFNYRRLDGTMSVLARDRAVSDFKTMPEVTVIIMSLKAASLGLNMVAACHVLLLDVWWNPTTEDQAIDRAHRIGQTRTVSVSRFTVKNTIEDRILELQEKKRLMCASAFGESYGGGQEAKLTGDDFRYLFNVH